MKTVGMNSKMVVMRTVFWDAFVSTNAQVAATITATSMLHARIRRHRGLCATVTRVLLAMAKTAQISTNAKRMEFKDVTKMKIALIRLGHSAARAKWGTRKWMTVAKVRPNSRPS